MRPIVIVCVLFLSLITHATKGVLTTLSKNDDGDYSYSTQMCALSTDMLKMAISFFVLKFRSTCQKEPRVMLSLAEILSMSIPAILVAAADIIFYYLQTTLKNELVIQAFGSLEIVVIGIASFLLLGRSLNGIQWASIMLLCTSVMSIEIGSYDSSSSLLDLPIFPSLLAVFCSGLEGTAGVLYEKILKNHNEMNFFHQTMWLTFWGSIVHILFLLFRGWNTFVQNVTFSNFNLYAFLFILSESLRGIVIIFIFKYADSLTESLVSCASLILASFVSSIILHRVLPVSFYISVLNLSIATYLYESAPETPNVLKKAESVPAESIEYEKE